MNISSMNSAMHWVRFRAAGATGFGTFDGTRIATYTGDMFDRPQATGVTLEGGFTLLSPCVPSKMVALWNNFRALAAKMGKPAPTHPLFLLKPGTSVIGPHEPIQRPTGYAGKIAYEGELGIVIGRRCKDVSVDDAPRHIFGYTCVNDVTAADVLNETPDFAQWCRSKGFDTFGSVGPAIVTEFDWSQARVVTRLGGVERQSYLLSDMIIPPLELVSRISHDMTLLPGDVIACGTSLGVGSIREGVDVEVRIDGIGSLFNALSPAAPAVPAVT
jgi:2-keto-4-pentenoate hydratase/2-oxohepta-3-ene-1,7-dioic acid hydratase in catechol pathway